VICEGGEGGVWGGGPGNPGVRDLREGVYVWICRTREEVSEHETRASGA
jgi:hypothetical protein